MSRAKQSFFFVLLAMCLIMACAALMPTHPIATTIPSSIAIATSTTTPAVSSATMISSIPTIPMPTFDSFQPVTRVDLDSSDRILDLVVESDSNVWLLTDHRVQHYSQGTWKDYLSQFSGTLIGMDSNHRIWIVSDDRTQVSAWDGSAWTVFGPQTGWGPSRPDSGMAIHWSIATDAFGQVWLATDRDVRMFDGSRWKIFTLSDLGISTPQEDDTYSETSITFLTTSGYIWTNNCYWIPLGPNGGGGARWYDGHTWRGFDSPVAQGCATTVTEDGRGNIWLGVDNDLWRLNISTDNWKRFSAPKPPSEGSWFGFFSNLTLDPLGNPWPELSLCGGASCYVGNVRYHVTEGNWLQVGDRVIDTSFLHFDTAGQGWVFTSSGIFRVVENRLEPVAALSILKAAVDPSGKLWMIGVYEGETVLWTQGTNR